MRTFLGIAAGILIARWLYKKYNSMATPSDPTETWITNEWSPRNKDDWES